MDITYKMQHTGAVALSFQIAFFCIWMSKCFYHKKYDLINIYHVGTRNTNIQMRLHRELRGPTQLFRQTATVLDRLWAQLHFTHAESLDNGKCLRVWFCFSIESIHLSGELFYPLSSSWGKILWLQKYFMLEFGVFKVSQVLMLT